MSLNINVTDKTLDKIKNLIIETLHLNFIKSYNFDNCLVKYLNNTDKYDKCFKIIFNDLKIISQYFSDKQIKNDNEKSYINSCHEFISNKGNIIMYIIYIKYKIINITNYIKNINDFNNKIKQFYYFEKFYQILLDIFKELSLCLQIEYINNDIINIDEINLDNKLDIIKNIIKNNIIYFLDVTTKEKNLEKRLLLIKHINNCYKDIVNELKKLNFNEDKNEKSFINTNYKIIYNKGTIHMNCIIIDYKLNLMITAIKKETNLKKKVKLYFYIKNYYKNIIKKFKKNC